MSSPSSLATIVKLWLGTRLLALVLAGWAASRLPHQSGFMPPVFSPWLEAWNKGDVWLYLDIAANGYHRLPYLGNYGWMPGFPLLVRCFGWLTPPLLAGLVASNLALLAALLVWWKLLRLDHSESEAGRSILLLLCFPTAFYFTAPLSESLFLALSVGAFWAARRQRWAAAAVLAAAAASTRWVGLLLLPALAWEFGRSRRTLWLLLIPLAHLAFCWHLHTVVGDALGYYHLQRQLEPFLQAATGQKLVGLASVPVAWWMLWVSWPNLRGSYRIYVLLSLLVPFGHSPLIAHHRFMIVLFPLFSGCQARVSGPVMAGCVVLQTLATLQFALGNPVLVY